MAHDGDFAGQHLLQFAGAGILAVAGNQLLDGLTVQQGENLDVTLGIVIGHIEPELVEFVGGGALCVQPDVAFFRFAEFGAVGLANQGAGEGEGFAAVHAADELGTGGDVAPLVASAQLQNAALVFPEPVKVIALHELVAEFREGHALGGVTGQALFHAVLGHHVIDGDVLAYVADKVDEAVVLHPVVVVHQFGLVGGVGLKVQETGELGLDAGHVVVEGFLVQEVPFGRFHGRVSNHAGGPAHQGVRLVAAALEMLEYHDAHQVADMKGIGRGVNAHIGRLGPFHQFFFRTGHDVLNHASPPEFFYKIFHRF